MLGWSCLWHRLAFSGNGVLVGVYALSLAVAPQASAVFCSVCSLQMMVHLARREVVSSADAP